MTRTPSARTRRGKRHTALWGYFIVGSGSASGFRGVSVPYVSFSNFRRALEILYIKGLSEIVPTFETVFV